MRRLDVDRLHYFLLSLLSESKHSMRKLYLQLDQHFRRRTSRQILLRSLVLAVIFGVIDYKTGFEISFSFFYLIPIAVATVYSGIRNGMIVTLVSVFTWAASNRLAGEQFSSEWVRYWNTGIRFVTFSLIAYMLDQLNISVQHENLLARTDFLTGVNNSREFHRVMELELARARSFNKPVSLAYFDLDNFKQVNDRLGHSAGDELLRNVAQAVTSVIRKGDLLARVGGDEFVLFFSGADDKAIRGIVEKIRGAILAQTKAGTLGVTISVGVVTYHVPPATVDEMIQAADAVMYEVKAGAKDAALLRVMN